MKTENIKIKKLNKTATNKNTCYSEFDRMGAITFKLLRACSLSVLTVMFGESRCGYRMNDVVLRKGNLNYKYPYT